MSPILISQLNMVRNGPGGYSHTSGIYGCAALMVGFVKKLAPMMGAFLGIPAPIKGTFVEILPSLGVQNVYFPIKLRVGFSQNLHL